MRKSFNFSKQFKHLPPYVNTEQLLVQFTPNIAFRYKNSLLLCSILNLFLIPSQAAARCQETRGPALQVKKVFYLRIKGGWGGMG